MKLSRPVIGYLILSVGVFFALYGNYQTGQKNCQNLQKGRNALRAIIARSDEHLGRKGFPAYAYYKQHPQELVATHRENKRILARDLPPISC